MDNKIVKEFEVDVFWYELHEGKVTVKAESKEEASRIVKNNFEMFKNKIKQTEDTCRGVSYNIDKEFEAREVEQNEEVELNKEKVYEDRFDTDIYVTGTTGYSKGSILELGRVQYKDYVPTEEHKYKFGSGVGYTADYHYYNVGACSGRRRNDVLFDKGDFKKLLLRKIEEKHTQIPEYKRIDKNMISKNITEALSGENYAIVAEINMPKSSIKPRTIEIRAIKVEKYSQRCPYRIHLMDYRYINFESKEDLECTILTNKSKQIGNSKYFIFLNTKEHMSLLEKMVEEFTLDTL